MMKKSTEEKRPGGAKTPGYVLSETDYLMAFRDGSNFITRPSPVNFFQEREDLTRLQLTQLEVSRLRFSPVRRNTRCDSGFLLRVWRGGAAGLAFSGELLRDFWSHLRLNQCQINGRGIQICLDQKKAEEKCGKIMLWDRCITTGTRCGRDVAGSLSEIGSS